MIKLFVSGFPLNITEMELARLFFPYGNVDTIKLVCDRKTRVCKGYAFIEMTDEEGARSAVGALHDEPMGDRRLTVKFADTGISNTVPARTSQRPYNNPVRYSSNNSSPSTENKIKRPRKRTAS